MALTVPMFGGDPPPPATLLDRAHAAADAYQVADARRLYQQAVAEAHTAAVADRARGGVALAVALHKYAEFLTSLHLFADAEAVLIEATAALRTAREGGAADAARAELSQVANVRSRWLEVAGRRPEAAAWAGEEYRIRKAHAAAAPADRGRRNAWLTCADRYAHALYQGGLEGRAEAVLDECLGAVAAPDDPTRFPLVGLLANTRALVLKDAGRWEEAERAYTAALAAHRQALAADPKSTEARASVAAVLRNRGLLREMLERTDDSLRDMEEAGALERSRPAAPPGDRDQLIQDLGRAIQMTSAGLPAGTPARDPAASGAARKRAADHPDVPAFQFALVAHLGLDMLHAVGAQDVAGAAAGMSELIAVTEGLRARHPDVPTYRAAANLRVGLGLMLRHQGRAAEAEAQTAAGLADLAQQADEHPDDPTYRWGLGEGHASVAAYWLQLRRPADAHLALAAAAPHYRRLAEQFPDSLRFGRTAAQCGQNIGMNLFTSSRFAEAEAELRVNLAEWEALSRKRPDAPYFRDQLARTGEYLACALMEQPGKLAEARAAADRARALRAGVAGEFPAERRFRDRLAQSHVLKGNLLTRSDDPAGAAAAYGRAVDVLDGMLRTNPKDGAARHDLAEALKKRATAHNAAGDFAAFTRDYDRAQELARDASQ